MMIYICGPALYVDYTYNIVNKVSMSFTRKIRFEQWNTSINVYIMGEPKKI